MPDLQQHQDVEKAQLTTSPWRTVMRNAPAFNATLVLHQWVPLWAPTPWLRSWFRALARLSNQGPGLIYSLPRHWEASPKSCPRAPPPPPAPPTGSFLLLPVSGGTESWRKCSARCRPFSLPSNDVPHSSPRQRPAHSLLGAKPGPPAVLLNKVLLAQPCPSLCLLSWLPLPYNGRVE